MRTVLQRFDLAALTVLSAAVIVSWGCEWDENTTARYETWLKTTNEVIAQASKEKEKCNQRTDRSAKEACYKSWDELLQELLKRKELGAAAFFRCDGDALDQILKVVEDAIKKAAELAAKKFPLTGAGATNFADRLDDAPVDVRIQGFEIFRDGNRHSYQLFGQVGVSYTDGATFDNYPVSGQIVIDVNPAPAVAHCTLIDMDIVLDFDAQGTCSADLHVTDDLSNPTAFDLPVSPSGYEGRMCGWLDYALENWNLNGSYVTSLGVALDPSLGQIGIFTYPGETSAAVFPEDPAPTGPYIYHAGFSTDLAIGRDATVEAMGVEPLAPLEVFGAGKMAFPTGTFQGAPWDIAQGRQRRAGATTADGDGLAILTFRVPNKPRLIGRTFFFQGLARESGGNRSTIAFSAPILP